MICSSCWKIIKKINYNVNSYLKPSQISIGSFKPDISRSLSFNEVLCRYSSSTGSRFQEIKDESVLKKGGFAKSYDKFSISETIPEQEEQSFPSLLRNSKFVDLGDSEGKIVTGTVIHVVENDLYIDFGWKFHCVVSRPMKNEHEYVRGAKVRLILKDLELSSRFLGSEKDLTLLEADATLIGLISSPAKAGSTSTG